MLLPILCLIFLFSGAAALLFETLWFRGAGLSFGNSVWASSITLAAYMGGLALGNFLIGRFGRRVRFPLRTYAYLELFIAVVGMLLVLALPKLADILAPLLGAADQAAWWSAPLRLGLAFVLLMLPTTAMGATLPLLVMLLCRAKTGYGKALGYLYGFNTLGAMFGAVAGEVFLIEHFGLLGTGLSAGLLNVLAAVLSFYLAARTAPGAANGVEAAAGTSPGRYGWRIWVMLLASFLAGGVLLGAEVLWFRFLRLFFLDTDVTFVVMLAIVLGGIALGGMLAGAILSRWPGAKGLATASAGLCGVVFALSYAGFDPAVAGGHWYIDPASIGKLSFLLMFPSALASGALFTFLGQAIHRLTGSAVESTAVLTTANTTGAMLGALLAAFVLLPGLGVERSIWVLASTYAAVFVCLLVVEGWPRSLALRVTHGATAVVLAGTLLGFPFGQMQSYLDAATLKFRSVEDSHTVASNEGLTETLQYLRHDWLGEPVFFRLMTNGFSMSDSQPGSRRYMGLYAYWPAAVHPALNSALLISYGVGNTAKSLTQIPSLAEIHVVDISRDIIRHADVPYPGASNPLRDPRVTVHIDDGRFFLQSTTRRFDLITSEPPPPRAPGVINLYTEEYFRLIRERLSDGGFATYWLPVHNMTGADARSIIKGFCNAFPDCSLWDGYGQNWMMVGSRDARLAASAEQFSAQWQQPGLLRELEAVGLERPEMLGATFMADASQLSQLLLSTPPLTDNFPKRYSQAAPNAADEQFYASWMDFRRTSENFRASAWIKHFWPEALRAASLDYFVVQQAVNVPAEIAGKGLRLQMLAEAMRHPGLKTPILWLLDTHHREVEIALAAKRAADPAVAYVLGANALAQAALAPAADYFAAALQGGEQRALAPLLFSLCRDGQAARAQSIARTYVPGGIKNSLARCW